MSRKPSLKDNLNLRTDQYTNHNIGNSTMASDTVEARVIGIPGKDGVDGTGGGSYTNFEQVPLPIGGIDEGETFDNITFTEMFDKLLYPYVLPEFSSFSIVGQNLIYEVGETSIGGEKEFIWSTTSSNNVNLVKIFQDVNDVSGWMPNDSSQFITLDNVTQTTQSSFTWRIESDNTDNSTSSRNFSIFWMHPIYYGVSENSTLDATNIILLTNKILKTYYNDTYSFTNTGYKYIAYPVSFGTVNSEVDPNTGFRVAMDAPYIINVTNVFGVAVDYYVYRTINRINSDISITLS